MRALVLFDQRLPIRHGNLVVVGMNLVEGKKAVAVAAIFNERGLQRRLDARHLGEIDVASQLTAVRRFEIELLDAVAAYHHHPSLLWVGGVDKHLVGH